MTQHTSWNNPLRRLARDRRGNVAIVTGLCCVPLILFTGAGVDFSRVVQFRRMLQNATDAAALAGASQYVTSNGGDAVTVASNYMGKTIAELSPGSSGAFTVTPSTFVRGGATYATVGVTVSADLPTTLLTMVMPKIAVTTTATATEQCLASGCGAGASTTTSSWGTPPSASPSDPGSGTPSTTSGSPPTSDSSGSNWSSSGHRRGADGPPRTGDAGGHGSSWSSGGQATGGRSGGGSPGGGGAQPSGGSGGGGSPGGSSTGSSSGGSGGGSGGVTLTA